MTVRVVPLDSDEASDGRVGGTAAERLLVLRELSLRAWSLTKRPVTSYSRSTMPVTVSTLSEQ